MTEYRADLFAHRYFGRFGIVLGVLFIGGFMTVGEYVAVAVVTVVAALVVARIRARRMIFSSDSFRYDGWLTSFTIPLAEVARVVPGHSFGYPIDRIHGGEYCLITTAGKRRWVSLLLFSPSACRHFHEQLVARGRDEAVA